MIYRILMTIEIPDGTAVDSPEELVLQALETQCLDIGIFVIPRILACEPEE